MSTSSPSNLSDAQWECLQRHLPAMSRRGRPPTHLLRAIFDAIFYVLRTGCPWRYLPANFPPGKQSSLIFVGSAIPGTWFRLLTALRAAERERVGRNAHPSVAIMDAASTSRLLRNLPGSAASMHTHA